MKYSHSGQKIPENAMRGPKIPENGVLSQGFRTGFDWFCTIRTGGRHAGDRKKKTNQNMCNICVFVVCFVLFVLVKRVFVLMDR